MERDFNNDEFEIFLKQKADQYKLYPSDSVWKGIYRSLHSRKRWMVTGAALLLVTGSLFIGHNLFVKHPAARSQNSQQPRAGVILSSAQHTPAPARLHALPVPSITPPHQAPIADVHKTVSRPHTLAVTGNTGGAETALPVFLPFTFTPAPDAEQDAMPQVVVQQPSAPQDHRDAVIVAQLHDSTSTLVKAEKIIDEKEPERNWLQEMATIKLSHPRESRIKLQFYFSPTIGYRRLADNKNNVNPYHVIPLTSGQLNINRYVDHKPAIGLELGSNVLFIAGRNLTLKSGMQLNYSRYNIKAYKFYNEKASIALNTTGHSPDTITAITSFRNFNGYAHETLQNQYLEISLPIGAEIKLLGNKRLQLNVAGTLQPGYLLFSDTYLLSTDYVNYAKEPSLIRRWNIHTSMEAFVSYKTGGIRWQVGPQFRYQLLSSFSDRYPIKEYLMEYGIKLGLSKTFR